MSDSLTPDDDRNWSHWRRHWTFKSGITYLNHGSFGPPPDVVRAAQREHQDRLAEEPMDFFVRELEPALCEVRNRLAQFAGASAGDLALVENATYGMNIVAASVRLASGDEVLVTDHEYGAVLRVWQRACDRAGAALRTMTLPYPLESAEAIVECIAAAVTPRTRLLVVSHVTSATAVVLPIEAICRLARQRDLPVCVDGPHALATRDLRLTELDCDYYVASGHKWLSAPFGSGFLYVHPRAQRTIQPPILSWGRISPAVPQRWDEELVWLGTRDPTAYLTLPTAIDFLESAPIAAFRTRTHQLAQYARTRIVELTGLDAIVPDSSDWYGPMLVLPLPPGESRPLQQALRERFGIEVPIIDWQGRRFVRPSCHLYTQRSDVDLLTEALGELLGG